MKELRLKRIDFASSYTMGKLYYKDRCICDTLEDTYRDLTNEKKVFGKTAIPNGMYEIRLNHSPKFGRTMPYLLNVPNFTYIMIHWGNTVYDTAGCVLVGKKSGYGILKDSKKTFQKVYELIKREGISKIIIE